MRLLTPLQRRLLGYLRPYLFPYLVCLIVAMLVLSATNGAIPLLVRPFINQLSKFSPMLAWRRIRERSRIWTPCSSPRVKGTFISRGAAPRLGPDWRWRKLSMTSTA